VARRVNQIHPIRKISRVKTKLSVSIAAAALAALVFAGCSSADPDPSPTATSPIEVDEETAALQAEAKAALEKVEWIDGEDGVPALEFEKPFSVGVTAARMVEDGHGDEIKADQIVTLAYTVTDGNDGTVAYSTYDEGGSPEAVTLSEFQIDPVLIDLLVGAHVGADFIYAAVDNSSETPSSVLMAVTVTSAFTPLTRAEGETVTPPAGLPAVTLAEDGAPSVEIPAGAAPAELVAQTLIKGEGAVVEEGQTITAHYTGWVWDDASQPFDSSWEKGTPMSRPLAQGQLIDGWVQGLVGQTVGSQVLLVIPSDLGYGDEGNGTIPGGATLVFVVDILAAA